MPTDIPDGRVVFGFVTFAPRFAAISPQGGFRDATPNPGERPNTWNGL